MTRKDYILIAEALRTAHKHGLDADTLEFGATRESTQVMIAAHCVADALASSNPRFDREHFLAVVRGERELNSRPSRRQ